MLSFIIMPLSDTYVISDLSPISPNFPGNSIIGVFACYAHIHHYVRPIPHLHNPHNNSIKGVNASAAALIFIITPLSDTMSDLSLISHTHYTCIQDYIPVWYIRPCQTYLPFPLKSPSNSIIGMITYYTHIYHYTPILHVWPYLTYLPFPLTHPNYITFYILMTLPSLLGLAMSWTLLSACYKIQGQDIRVCATHKLKPSPVWTYWTSQSNISLGESLICLGILALLGSCLVAAAMQHYNNDLIFSLTYILVDWTEYHSCWTSQSYPLISQLTLHSFHLFILLLIFPIV